MKEILEIEGQKVVDYIKYRLRQEDKISSGDLYNSIRYEVKEDSEGNWSLTILSLDYLKYVDEGRRPGSTPPIDKIKLWIKDKGINWTNPNDSFASLDQKAFVISRSIKEKGIKPTNILKSVSNKVSSELLNKVKEGTIEKLNKDIADIIKNNFNNK